MVTMLYVVSLSLLFWSSLLYLVSISRRALNLPQDLIIFLTVVVFANIGLLIFTWIVAIYKDRRRRNSRD